MTAASWIGWACGVLRPAVLILAVAGADATTRAAHTWPHHPWWIAQAALAAGALAGGLWTIHANRPQQETNR